MTATCATGKPFAGCLKLTHPTLVIHLAAVVGGIDAPGKFFYENAITGIELIEQARQCKIPKIVVAGTICA